MKNLPGCAGRLEQQTKRRSFFFHIISRFLCLISKGRSFKSGWQTSWMAERYLLGTGDTSTGALSTTDIRTGGCMGDVLVILGSHTTGVACKTCPRRQVKRTAGERSQSKPILLQGLSWTGPI